MEPSPDGEGFSHRQRVDDVPSAGGVSAVAGTCSGMEPDSVIGANPASTTGSGAGAGLGSAAGAELATGVTGDKPAAVSPESGVGTAAAGSDIPSDTACVWEGGLASVGSMVAGRVDDGSPAVDSAALVSAAGCRSSNRFATSEPV